MITQEKIYSKTFTAEFGGYSYSVGKKVKTFNIAGEVIYQVVTPRDVLASRTKIED